jgi:hypothetical protein
MKCIIAFALLMSSYHLVAQTTDERIEVMNVVNNFFNLLEKQDSVSLRGIFLKESHDYYVKDDQGRVVSGGRPSHKFKFSPSQLLVEKIRQGQETINIHKRLAVVWAPYDFWINGKVHHCGVDAFTLIKTASGWKIASIAFTIEQDNCVSN